MATRDDESAPLQGQAPPAAAEQPQGQPLRVPDLFVIGAAFELVQSGSGPNPDRFSNKTVIA
jgi:hypothetical protein